MNGKMLNIEDISRMSEQQLSELYRQGYKLEGAIQKSEYQSCAAPGNIHALAGTCSGTMTVCVPNWQVGPWGPCQPGDVQTRTVTDLNNCGSDRLKPITSQYCAYDVEANIVSCGAPYPIPGKTITPGIGFYIPMTIQKPTLTGTYRVDLAISGYTPIISSAVFGVSAGTDTVLYGIAFTLPDGVAAGSKTHTATLVRV